MKVALLGISLLSLYLLVGWTWIIFVGLSIITLGLMFDYKPPQEDIVWKKLVADGVIDKKGDKPDAQG